MKSEKTTDDIRKIAAELGRRGGLIGGKAKVAKGFAINGESLRKALAVRAQKREERRAAAEQIIMSMLQNKGET